MACRLANEGILLIWALGTNFSEIVIESEKIAWKCRLRNGGDFVSMS